MPDDFDYSQPVSRNRVLNGSTPILTMALVTLCVVLTGAYWIAPTDNPGNPLYKLVHVILLSPSQIWDGHYLGLFTSFFIHLDLMHLVFNMYWTWKMGTTLEMTIAPWKYLLFVVVATMVGSCCELLISGQTGAGASGAGYALMGLLWAGRGYHDSWRKLATRENMQLFLVWGVLCIVLTAMHTFPVANGAHFGGLLFGLAVGHLFFAPRRKPIWITALVLLAAACVVSLTWMPWSSSWNWHKGLQADRRHRYTDAIAYYERSLREGGERAGLLNNIALCWFEIGDDDRAHNRNEAADAAYAKSEELLAASKGAVPPATSEDAPDSSDQSAPSGSKTGSDRMLRPHK